MRSQSLSRPSSTWPRSMVGKGQLHPTMSRQGIGYFASRSSTGKFSPCHPNGWSSAHPGKAAMGAWDRSHARRGIHAGRPGRAPHDKFTLFAILLVEQNEQGSWLAYRDDFPLLKKGHPARFASCKEAQRCAEAHELDLYPGAKAIDDGLSWVPDPEMTGARSRTSLRSALPGSGWSGWLP